MTAKTPRASYTALEMTTPGAEGDIATQFEQYSHLFDKEWQEDAGAPQGHSWLHDML